MNTPNNNHTSYDSDRNNEGNNEGNNKGTNEATIQEMTARLKNALSPISLNIIDESHLHVGHAGAQPGKGHFALTIACQALASKSRIESHKMIYQALGDLMETRIHALSIKIEK